MNRIGLSAVILIVTIIGLGLLRNHLGKTSPGAGAHQDGRPTLTVGFMPVTCHLTCPVTDFASRISTSARFESKRFASFPEMAEAVKTGALDATFMILPLAMKLREQGVPVKIAYLGHRDGSTLIVRKDFSGTDLRGLKGKRLAIPMRYSNQNLVLHKLMNDLSMAPEDIEFIELPPPDMPTALASNAIDAYFVGEPHAARAELDGSGKVLHHVKDIWPNFISCGLVVTERLIHEKPELVRELVRDIAKSGVWIEGHREEAAHVAAPYFRQKEEVIRYVLTVPKDRVRYDQLTPDDAELQKIHDMGLQLGIFTKPLAMAELIDRSFISAEF
jgi:NitT/TauT family transport system substrate-binding protein